MLLVLHRAMGTSQQEVEEHPMGATTELTERAEPSEQDQTGRAERCHLCLERKLWCSLVPSRALAGAAWEGPCCGIRHQGQDSPKSPWSVTYFPSAEQSLSKRRHGGAG